MILEIPDANLKRLIRSRPKAKNYDRAPFQDVKEIRDMSFTAIFDAAPTGHGDFLNSTDLDWSELKFSAPKKAASSSDHSCIARASFGSDRSAFQITLKGASVDRVTHTRADFHTLFVRLPVGPVVKEKKGKKSSAVTVSGGDLKKFTDSLDLHVMEVAKGKVEEWFNRSMSEDLIEEYYRGSTTSAQTLSTRFVISGDLSDRLSAGSPLDITVQLVGVQFRSQYFTCVWKIVSLSEPVIESKGGFGFFPDDEEDPEEDTEEPEEPYPTEDERIELVQAESQRLSILVEKWEKTADDLQQSAKDIQDAMSDALVQKQNILDAIHRLSIAGASEFAEAYAGAEAIRQ